MGFFFVQLKPWEERTHRRIARERVVAALNKAFAQQIPEAGVIAVRAAVDPGPWHRRRLHDAAAGSQRRLAGLPGRADARFMEAARKRPEIGRIGTLYRAAVPQVYADIDQKR